MNKNVLITGGSKGIGFHTAKIFIEHGYNAIITGRNKNRLQAAVDTLGDKASFIEWDIGDIKSGYDKIIEARNFFGDITVFINNAGIVTDDDMNGVKFPYITEENWGETMNINLKGTFFACQSEVKYMLENNICGHIVNVCSEMGCRPAYDPYSISKWGVHGFTKGIAKRLAPLGIIMNGIAPGETATEILRQKEGEEKIIDSPRGKRAMPKEIAEEIYFLATRENIIGSVLLSDGGRSLF